MRKYTQDSTELLKIKKPPTPKTNIKIIDVCTEDMDVNDFNFYECMNCNWRFVGDAKRYGHGFTSEDTDFPIFCPMCGRKIFID